MKRRYCNRGSDFSQVQTEDLTCFVFWLFYPSPP